MLFVLAIILLAQFLYTQHIYSYLTHLSVFFSSFLSVLSAQSVLYFNECLFVTDLAALGCMPYLLSLDVSHNELTTVLDFKPPLGLRVCEVTSG